MSTKQLQFSEIIADDEIMPRDQIDSNYVDELVEDLETGAKFPPVYVIFDGERYLLVDGFHRLEAAIKAGHKKIEVVAHKGNKRDALLQSSRANANHGKRRTNKDKRKAVKKVMMDTECCKWSDGKIAQYCAVTQQFVSKVRRELTQNGFESPTERLGEDGRITNVSNNGKHNSLEQVSGTSSWSKVPFPIPNLPKQTSTTDGSGTKTNPSTKQNAKTKKGKPKTLQITDAEKSEMRVQISEITYGLRKLDKMLENNKSWTKDRAKKLMMISEENELRWTGITRFVQDLNGKFI